MSNDLTTTDDDFRGMDTFLPATVFDVERFEQIMRVADVMARATTIPDHLKGKSQDANERFEETRGNCFMICNQSAHWGMDPFAVAQATAFVFGKVCYEGKLIRAVIKKRLGFDLNYAFFGDPGKMERSVYVSDKPLLDQDGKPLDEGQIIALRGTRGWRITVGTLAKWHTKNKSDGINDNWKKDEDKMFRERGSREWCREFAPGLMLGVYSPDEFDDVDQTSRSSRARDVTGANPLLESKPAMAMERFDPETGEFIENSGAQADRTVKTTSARSSDDDSRASAAPARQAGRATDTRDSDRSPTNTASSTSSQGGSGDGGGEEPRISSAVFKEYSQALLRFSSAENIEKGHNAFWDEKGGKPRNTADIELVKVILRLHKDRVQNGVAPDKLLKDANGAISQSFAI